MNHATADKMTIVTAGKTFTTAQRFILARLERLLRLREQAESLDKRQSTLLKRALYSSYLDCLEAGLSAEARELLGSEPDQVSTN